MLTIKEISDEVKELINTMSPKEIIEWCQYAVKKASISGTKLHGINKLVKDMYVHCATEDQAKQLHIIDWSKTF